MKIAIFGGSFNPVHREHVNIVKAAIRELSLDKVIIMPSNLTPNKHGRLTASGIDRLNMCRLAFSGIDNAEVSDYEINKGGVSYSYLTCRAFRDKFKDDELYFIIGADMLENFHSWKYPEEILKCVKLAVCARENTDTLNAAEKTFKSYFNEEIVKFSYIGAKVSSTKIRTLAALNESIEEYVLKNTADYIKENGIYSLDKIKDVKKLLKPERWLHTLRVAVMAAENCARLGIDEKTAITAAALHDCAKYLKPDSPYLAGFVCPENVPEPVVHQYAGAYVAEHTFGINDKQILNAIACHTSGKEDMSPLEKLLFLCDMLEEGRDFEGVEDLREIFSHSIDGALYESLKYELDYLKCTGKPIYSLTLRAYEYIYEYIKEKRNEQ